MKLFSPLFPLLSFLLITNITCFVQTDYEIRDLMQTDPTLFASEIAPWVFSTSISTKTSSCNGSPLLGGKNIFLNGATLSRTYTGLKPHQSLRIGLYFYGFGPISPSNRQMILQATGSPDYDSGVIKYTGWPTDWGEINCAGVGDSERVFLSLTYPHTASSVTITLQNIVSGLGIGIREVSVIASQDIVSASKFAYYLKNCGSFGEGCDGPNCPSGDSTCKSCRSPLGGCMSCADKYFFNGVQCIACHSSCLTCEGTLETDCRSCPTGQFLSVLSTCVAASQCTSPYTQNTQNQIHTCDPPCPDPQDHYFKNSGDCKPNCLSPFTPADDVFERLRCNFPCDLPTPYYTPFYTSNPCLQTCDYPFTDRTVDSYKYCDAPCLNQDFWYTNDSCHEDCNYPFAQNVQPNQINKCEFPCNNPESFNTVFNDCWLTCPQQFELRDEGGFLYCDCNSPNFAFTNRSCENNCPYPFTSRQVSTIQYCDFPCPSGELYSSSFKECWQTCPADFEDRDEGTFLYCDCDAPLFAYQNKTCLSGCPYPFISRKDGNLQHCDWPCQDLSHFFDPFTNTCMPSCPVLTVSDKRDAYNYCTPTIQQEEINEIKDLVSMANTTEIISSIGTLGTSLASIGNPLAVFVGTLAKMLQYAKYMNISLTPRVVAMFQASPTSFKPLKVGPDMSDDLKREFPSRPIPPSFTAYRLHSSFIVNFWNNEVALLIIGTILLLAILAIRFLPQSTNPKGPVTIAKKIQITVSNFLLVLFYQMFGDIMLFSIFELKYAVLDSAIAGFTLVFAMVFLVLAGIVLYIHLQTLRQYQSLKSNTVSQTPGKIQTFKDKTENKKLFYEKFSDYSLFGQSFLLFFAIRSILVNMALGFLFEYPLVQTSVMCFLAFVMLGFVVIKRPFKSKIDFIQQIILETFLLLVNIGLVTFAILDATENYTSPARDFFGEIILWTSVVFNFLPILAVLAQVIVFGVEYYKAKKLTRLQGTHRVVQGRNKMRLSSSQLRNRPQHHATHRDEMFTGEHADSQEFLSVDLSQNTGANNFNSVNTSSFIENRGDNTKMDRMVEWIQLTKGRVRGQVLQPQTNFPVTPAQPEPSHPSLNQEFVGGPIYQKLRLRRGIKQIINGEWNGGVILR